MRYMLVIYGNYAGWKSSTQEDFQKLMTGHGRLQAQLTASGEFVATSELPLDNAKVVSTRSGFPVVTAGPLNAEGDIVAGYYVVECTDVERASDIAGLLAEIEFGLIEVRQMTRDPQH
jgi:hypothetical protein